MRLLDTLSLTDRGKAWLKILPDECTSALNYIDSKLFSNWSNTMCYPHVNRVLLPFHMIAPDEVVMVIICKEPYGSYSMATGIPIETGGRLDTLSQSVFMNLISKYWSNVDKDNFMRCYYASGILVINSSFTITPTKDKRYSLTQSHFPLWTRFCYPLVRYLNSINIPILGLGMESKGLLRNSPNASMVYHCPFPIDRDTIVEFYSITQKLIDAFVFQRSV